MQEITVTLLSEEPAVNPKQYKVELREGKSKSTYQVTLSNEYYQTLASSYKTREELIKVSFEFLLEREPRESILKSFDLTLIKEFFPEYEKGKILTYSGVAKRVGIKNPRVVGNILHKNPDPEKIPCHRVVNSKGKIAEKFAYGGAKGQIRKLLNEGIQVKDKRVDVAKYLFRYQ